MAKRKATTATAAPGSKPDPYADYEVSDAYHTLKRAAGHIKDKTMMAKVKAHAGKLAKEAQQFGQQIDVLAKSGRISEQQMAKIKKDRAMV